MLAFSCFTSFKCLSQPPEPYKIEVMVFILTPFLLEIILVEMFLMIGRKIKLIKMGRNIKLHLNSLLKVIVLGLAIANLCLSYSKCDGSTRTVSYSSKALLH